MDKFDFVDIMTELMMLELDIEENLEFGTEDLEAERKSELLFIKVAHSF
jgi:hypothetical protein